MRQKKTYLSDLLIVTTTQYVNTRYIPCHSGLEDGIVTGSRLKEVQYYSSGGHLYLIVEGARPTHSKLSRVRKLFLR